MTPANLQKIMIEAAPLCDLLVVDYFEAQKTWHIAASRDAEIFGELDERRGVLVLSMPLNSPPDMDQQLLDLALRYGHAWDAADGFRLTLQASEGPFWLVIDLAAEGLAARTLAAIIRDMVAKGAAWREVITSPLRDESREDNLAVLSSTGIMRA